MSYNARKAAQTIAYMSLKNGGRPLNVVKAVKLVYLADRESIKNWGAPIQDELFVSMPLGPVNSRTYAHINGESDLNACGWSDFLEDRANHNVALARQNIAVDDLDELSDADMQCLDIVWQEFGHMNEWQIVDWTHKRENVPEWEDPDGSSRPIPLERIMTLLGIENADATSEMIDDHRRIDRLFAALAG